MKKKKHIGEANTKQRTDDFQSLIENGTHNREEALAIANKNFFAIGNFGRTSGNAAVYRLDLVKGFLQEILRLNKLFRLIGWRLGHTVVNISDVTAVLVYHNNHGENFQLKFFHAQGAALVTLAEETAKRIASPDWPADEERSTQSDDQLNLLAKRANVRRSAVEKIVRDMGAQRGEIDVSLPHITGPDRPIVIPRKERLPRKRKPSTQVELHATISGYDTVNNRLISTEGQYIQLGPTSDVYDYEVGKTYTLSVDTKRRRKADVFSASSDMKPRPEDKRPNLNLTS